MDISTFIFGDYSEERAKNSLSDIGAIISYTGYADIQLREIFHELLFNQYFDVAAEIFDGINSINQKKKIILGLSKKLLDDNLNLKLKDFFKKYDAASSIRNDIAHGYLSPFRGLQSKSIKEYHVVKPSKDYFKDPLKSDKIRRTRDDAHELATEAFLLREQITIFMKLNGSNLTKGNH